MKSFSSVLQRPTTLLGTMTLIAALCADSGVRAATVTWDGGGAASNGWSNSTNWTSDTGPANPAVTPGTVEGTPEAGVDVVNLNATSVIDGPSGSWYAQVLNLNSASAFTLSSNAPGGTLTLRPLWGVPFSAGPPVVQATNTHDGRIFLTNSGAGVKTISSNLTVLPSARGSEVGGNNGGSMNLGSGSSLVIDGTTTFQGLSGTRLAGSGLVTFNGIVAGATGGIAVNGATAIFKNLGNTYTGATIVYSGTIVAGGNVLSGSGVFGTETTAISLGYSGANGLVRMLTRSDTNSTITVARGINLTSSTATTANYTIGSDGAHVTDYTGLIFLSTDASGSVGEKLTVTSAAGGRVNFTNNIATRANASSGGAATYRDSLVKTGAGIVAIGGSANNWRLQTLVNEGTLLMNGTLTASTAPSPNLTNVVVSSSAALGGFGTINRDVLFSAGASILTPGDINASNLSTVGTLTINGSLAFSNSANLLNFDLGASSDKVTVNGNLTLTGTLNILDSGGFGVGTYELFDYSGTLTDNTLTVGTKPNNALTYSITNTGAGGSVYLVVAPEPGRALLLMLGCSALAFRRRRRVTA